MAKIGACEKETVIRELTQGRNYATQLKNVLHTAVTSTEACGFLLEKLVSNIDCVLSLIDCVDPLENRGPLNVSFFNILGPPDLLEGNPEGELSDPDSNDQIQQNQSKKRKGFPRSSEQVHACSEIWSEGQFEDGYYWRKYGQKKILGANHPRAYYRCTHRDAQGCLATKLVQRKDKDPSIFDVIYRGKHTCTQERQRWRNVNPNNLNKKEEANSEILPQGMNISNPKPDPEGLGIHVKDEKLPPFTFSSTLIDNEIGKPHFVSEPESFLGSSCSLPFLSSETSDSYFLLSPFHLTDLGISYNTQDSELSSFDMLSNTSPIMDFPSEELSFWNGHVDYDSHLEASGEFLSHRCY